MFRNMLLSKIHRARVTGADLHYEGSITVDEILMEAAGMLPYERVQVLNISNGERAETYVIAGERGSGQIILNGAIARMAQEGDPVIILAYGWVEDSIALKVKPKIILVDEKNRIIRSHK